MFYLISVSEMHKELYDVIIIGGGIAGSSAALYTARQGLRTAIITMDVGGQLRYANVIENYPGIELIGGLDLVLKVQKQAIAFGAEIFIDEVILLNKSEGIFIVKTRRGSILESLSVIAACGKAPKKLRVRGEENFIGKGLSYCVVCDGPLYKGRRIALNSFGENGIEALNLLAPIAKELIYIVPTKTDVSIQEAVKYGNVSVYSGYRVVELYGDEKLEKIVVMNGNGDREVVDVDALFIELGFETQIDFLKPYVDINERNEVVVDKYGTTKTEGLFAAGDLVDMPYKQAVVSAASGVIAALSAINYVNRRRGIVKNFVSDWKKSGVSQQRRLFRL